MLTSDGPANAIYELAGDGFTLADFAAEVTRQIGKTVLHSNLSPAEYREALVRAGIPGGVAEMLVDFDRAAARGDLDDSSDVLRRLIGRPPTSLHDAVAIALKAAA